MGFKHALMVVGTTSHAGKSTIAAAICRLLVRGGDRVTPFKGQNMALNAYVTATGGEIGYAQAVQAWAAGIEPRCEMNPILLKPQGDMTSQVILNGYATGTTRASEYYEHYFQRGWEAIVAALERLAADFDIVVCEGAGSPAEINLKHRDLTNMRVAKHLNASTLLVVDIDRGGAFAHVVGTLALLEPEERALIKGIAINKFRGQRSLLESGIEWLEKYTGIPVVGVIPWLDCAFPAEDSLDLLDRRHRRQTAEIAIGVVRLPRIANFTDFDPLDAEPTVSLHYLDPSDRFDGLDAVILPGSKTTIADANALRSQGTFDALQRYAKSGGTIFGICGGLQLLGEQISDPDGLEGEPSAIAGLGLLPISTIITPEKVTRQRQVRSLLPQPGLDVRGYEIHQGRSHWAGNTDKLSAFAPIFEDSELGLANAEKTIWGCYLHGIFDNSAWRRSWLNGLRNRRGLPPLAIDVPNYSQQREELLDIITDAIAPYLDLSPLLFPTLKLP